MPGSLVASYLTFPPAAPTTVRWTVHIDPALKDKILAESDARRLSLTDTVDLIVRHYFEREATS